MTSRVVGVIAVLFALLSQHHMYGAASPPPLVAPGVQAQPSIAVDATGQHVVVGFNDFRGFENTTDPLSISGVMYSDDGGETFVDGGRLTIPAGASYPQLVGDADVKYAGGCTFIYLTRAVNRYAGVRAEVLMFYRSTDCGHTWEGPFDVPPSINPNGGVNGSDAGDSARHAHADIDPDSGRYLVCWTNVTPVALGGVEISCTYSDDITASTPTFAVRRVLSAAAADGDGAVVRFAGNGSSNAVVAWTSFQGFYTRRIKTARSTDNGVTWSAPAEITTSFVRMDQVLGNDAVHEFPSVAVDTSAGVYANTIYVVYSNNNSLDGADVAMRRSTDGGITYSAPVLINSRPGNDRAQWFPHVTVDSTTGRVIVFYYDQGIETSGDLTEVTYTYSDDGGTTWSKPVPMSSRPFHAGWGNDRSTPNLGTYNDAVARAGTLWASFAATHAVGFTDGLASSVMNPPDVEVKRSSDLVKAALRLDGQAINDSGANGSVDRGEQINISLPVRNYVTNPLSASAITGITGTLVSMTPGVTVVQATAAYPDAAAGATVGNAVPFGLQISSVFGAGTPIELILKLSSGGGDISLPLTLRSGTPAATTLLSENFDGVVAGDMPAGWSSTHGAGSNVVPWTTSSTFCGASNKAFHQEADDAVSDHSRWEILGSPPIVVPADSAYVSVDFDVCYDTQDDPNLRILAFGGAFLSLRDITGGRVPRSVLAEAFAETFTTGSVRHYPKHLSPASTNAFSSEMSAWSGSSGGMQHVHVELPGMAGSTFALRFEYMQDASGTCADVRPGHACGLAVDNIVVKNVVATSPAPANVIWRAALTRDSNTGEIVAVLTATNIGGVTADGVVLTRAQLGATLSNSPLPAALGAIGAGASATTTVRFAGAAGTPGTQSILRLTGTFTGGTTGGSLRVTLP